MYKKYFICYRPEVPVKEYHGNDTFKFDAVDVMFLELNEEHSKEPRKLLFTNLKYDEEHYPLVEVTKEEFEERILKSVGAPIYRD